MKKEIRNTVKEALDGLTELRTTEIGRRHNFDPSQLPAAVIFTDNQESEPISCSPIRTTHQIELLIRLDIKPGGVTSGEDETDDILAAIDTVVLPAVANIDNIFDIVPVSIATEGNGETDADYLQTLRTYQIEYQTVQ